LEEEGWGCSADGSWAAAGSCPAKARAEALPTLSNTAMSNRSERISIGV
jgi:hypothetical protein